MNRSRRIALVTLLGLIGALVPASIASSYSSSYATLGSLNTVSQTVGLRSGNIVGLWQNILYADTFMAKCGAAGIDGYFGATTKNATINYQRYYRGQTAGDGIVGPATWSDAWTRFVQGGTGESGELNFYYRGIQANIWVSRWLASSQVLNYRGNWTFDSVSNPGYPGHHLLPASTSRTFYTC